MRRHDFRLGVKRLRTVDLREPTRASHLSEVANGDARKQRSKRRKHYWVKEAGSITP